MPQQLSERVSAWSILPTAALHGNVLEMQQKGVDIIDLTIGISNRPFPEAGKQAAIEAIAANNVPYTAITGTGELKKAIQTKVQHENKIACELENIIVATGAKQAIFEALYALTNPGDAVAMVTPYWSAYTQMATMLKLTPVFFTLADIPQLADKKAPNNLKAFLFDLPHNPTGKVFTNAELESVLTFSRKNKITIIADEGYEKLIYDGKQISIGALADDEKDSVVSVFSVSQSYSMMGWRLGYAVSDKATIQAMEAVQSSITAGASAITQIAATAILSEEHAYIEKLVADFKNRRNEAHEALSQIPWMHCDLPESGPYFWCDITKLTSDSLDFAANLLEQQKVAIMPGESFGSPGWIRIAFNATPLSVLLDAIGKIVAFGNTYQS